MNAMPGPPSIDDHDYDHSTPLKPVKVHPPVMSSVQGQPTYQVNVELSRSGSKWEIDDVRKFFPKGRIYGKTLELNDTTIETVAESTQIISSQLAALEREARKVEEQVLELQRQREEAAAAEEARYQRLSRMASDVKFE